MSDERIRSPKMRVLIAGCGFVGAKLGTLLAERGDEVWGLRRDPRGLPSSIHPLAVDLLDPDLAGRLPPIDRVVYAAAAEASTPESYRKIYVDGVRNLKRAMATSGSRVDRILFLSSTAVYGEDGGGWVDEETPTLPESFRGGIVLEGERAAVETIGEFDPPAVVLRLGGIYGPGRTRLLERVRSGEARCVEGTSEWSNRIHRDDAAGAVLHLLHHPDPEPLYLVVDDEPAPLCDVYRQVAQLLELPGPRIDVDSVDPKLTVERGKRCSNRRLRDSGYDLRFPTYREGYRAMVKG